MQRRRRTSARRSSSHAPAPATGTRGAATHPQAPLVLLVDDVQDAREMYAEFFAHAGFRVAQAVDGDHALLKVLSLAPDVIVMDLAMPGRDGWETTQEMKAHPKTKHIPVIALTGHATEPELRRAERAGADVVLTKPCTPDALLVAVRRVTAHTSAPDR